MNGIGRTMALVVSLGTLLGMALLLPAVAPATQAAPVPSSGGSTQSWAYGAEKWANLSASMPNGSYTLHAFFGWHVVLTATNTSATTVAVEINRTVAASLFASYCAPTCASPRASGNLSFRAFEQDAGFANFTTTATVYQNGSAAAAAGIQNAAAESRAGVNESLTLSFQHNGSTYAAGASLVAHGAAHAAVAFTPALGLVPWNASRGSTWNSSAAYAASGAWSFAWSASRTTLLGAKTSASGNPSGSVNTSGTLALQGRDLGTVTLDNGVTVPEIVLAISGPFDDEEGLVFVPHAFDLFGGGSHAWDSSSVGMATFATARVDLAIDAVHHRVQVVAGASSYAGDDSSLAPIGGVSQAARAPMASASPGTVQAQPESVARAQEQSNCLVSGCPSAPSSGPLGAIAGPVLVIGLLIGLIVGAVAVVEWRRWSKRGGPGGLPPGGGPLPGTGAPPAGASGVPSPPPPMGAPPGPASPPRSG